MRSIVLHSIRVKLQRLNTIYNIEDDEVVRYDDNGAGDEDWRMTGAESSGRKPECVAGGGSRPEPTTHPHQNIFAPGRVCTNLHQMDLRVAYTNLHYLPAPGHICTWCTYTNTPKQTRV